ncbi:hypothetical protein OHU45_25920 [Streptomyces tubercidicus]|uniref:hypothetical protein n=1 Tax=Streptomyces tubercidicus TaxID=47759 RepID=UPI0030DF4128
MKEEQPLIPRTQPPARRAGRSQKPSHKAPSRTEEHRLEQPLSQIAPHLQPPWLREDTDTPERTTLYTHPEGHRIGLRLQPATTVIQTWITAGPDLPPLPAGTAEEKADAQAANDARLQPGRSWHATVTTRHPQYTPALLGAVVRDQLLPALTSKPKRVPTTTVRPEPQPEAEPETTTVPANPRRATTKKKGTEK